MRSNRCVILINYTQIGFLVLFFFCLAPIIMEEAGAGRKEGLAAIEFFTHSAPETSFRFWDPRHDEESRTADLPDIPASEHRRQNLDAPRLSGREFRGRRSTAGRQTGIGVSGFF